jgi:uncharacterized protein YciI
MFVIELTYKVPLAEIDAHMTAHVIFLKRYYASGNFLVSGRKIPREGGIILAVGKTRREIEVIVEEDPFYKHGLADFRIIEFRSSQRADDIQKRIERY